MYKFLAASSQAKVGSSFDELFGTGLNGSYIQTAKNAILLWSYKLVIK
jgi:hypothetical protein